MSRSGSDDTPGAWDLNPEHETSLAQERQTSYRRFIREPDYDPTEVDQSTAEESSSELPQSQQELEDFLKEALSEAPAVHELLANVKLDNVRTAPDSSLEPDLWVRTTAQRLPFWLALSQPTTYTARSSNTWLGDVLVNRAKTKQALRQLELVNQGAISIFKTAGYTTPSEVGRVPYGAEAGMPVFDKRQLDDTWAHKSRNPHTAEPLIERAVENERQQLLRQQITELFGSESQRKLSDLASLLNISMHVAAVALEAEDVTRVMLSYQQVEGDLQKSLIITLEQALTLVRSSRLEEAEPAPEGAKSAYELSRTSHLGITTIRRIAEELGLESIRQTVGRKPEVVYPPEAIDQILAHPRARMLPKAPGYIIKIVEAAQALRAKPETLRRDMAALGIPEQTYKFETRGALGISYPDLGKVTVFRQVMENALEEQAEARKRDPKPNRPQVKSWRPPRRRKPKPEEPLVYPAELDRAQWDILRPRFATKRSGAKQTRIPNVKVVDAYLYKRRTGCDWRELPAEFPSPPTILTRVRKWQQAGIFDDLLQAATEKWATENIGVSTYARQRNLTPYSISRLARTLHMVLPVELPTAEGADSLPLLPPSYRQELDMYHQPAGKNEHRLTDIAESLGISYEMAFVRLKAAGVSRSELVPRVFDDRRHPGVGITDQRIQLLETILEAERKLETPVEGGITTAEISDQYGLDRSLISFIKRDLGLKLKRKRQEDSNVAEDVYSPEQLAQVLAHNRAVKARTAKAPENARSLHRAAKLLNMTRPTLDKYVDNLQIKTTDYMFGPAVAPSITLDDIEQVKKQRESEGKS